MFSVTVKTKKKLNGQLPLLFTDRSLSNFVDAQAILFLAGIYSFYCCAYWVLPQIRATNVFLQNWIIYRVPETMYTVNTGWNFVAKQAI